jgi:LPXTG-motif cell wall-anchored protein
MPTVRLRAFAAAWTAFTMLAAPALLAADEAVPEPTAEELVSQAPPAEPAPAPAPATEPPPPEPASAEQPPEQPAVEPEPPPAAEPAAAPRQAPKQKDRRRPVARAAASATVNVKDFEFAPTSVTVNVGDTVTWVNAGPTVHTATGEGFDTGNLNKGESGSHTFTSAGNFSYICTPHPFMKASVTVVASSAGQSGGDSGSSDAAADAGDGPTLADTGADTWLLALIGTGLLSLGVAVRRRSDSV